MRYDHSIGDKTEPRGGHGTKVGQKPCKTYIKSSEINDLMSDFSSSLSCNITTLKVAGAALGRSRDNANDTANGIAEEAKLHIFDIQQGSGEFEFDENA